MFRRRNKQKEQNLENSKMSDPAPDSNDSANESTKSIYYYIKANTKDGRLPEGFKIPWLDSGWAPGAHDGVLLNHMPPLKPDSNREIDILGTLMLMSAENYGDYASQIFRTLEKLDGEFGIVRLCDEINQIMFDHQKELNLENMLRFSDWILCEGISLLAIKAALTIISCYTVPWVEEVMMEVGIYDEFTYFSVRMLSRSIWPKGNDEIFTLAKKVHGWGRIHAVDMIEPETQEIRDWLLYEGAENTVMCQYSSDICLQKAEAEKRLDGFLSAKEYEAIGKLIRESLEGGPCRGVSNGEQLLPKYIGKAKEFRPDPDTIKLILEAADEYSLSEETIAQGKLLIE